MADKRRLRGSFGSLLDTLQNRLDPFFPPNVLGRWLGAIARAAGIGRDTAGWLALPDQDPRYRAIVEELDEATRAIVMADETSEPSLLAALDEADEALAKLAAIL